MNGRLPSDADVWRFPARPARVVDGDTLDVELDRGFRTYSEQRLRLYGVDTAETYGVSKDSGEYERGTVHKGFVIDWLDNVTMRHRALNGGEWPLEALTLKETGKYGRYLADVADHERNSLVAALFDEFGDEVAYDR